jgi:hypothetical protein
MITSLLIALAASAALTADLPAELPVLEKDPRTMSQSEIRAFNAGRVRKDPDFIRCVRSDQTGSLARKTFSCRTNAQWADADRVGNQNARETFQVVQSKAGSSSN